MVLNENLKRRLQQWKFKSCERYLDKEVDDDEREIILALASIFGNVGYHMNGEMSVIVGCCVATLLNEVDEEDDDDLAYGAMAIGARN